MATTTPSCVLLADRHHGLAEGVRGLLESSFSTVFIVADEASLLRGAERLKPRLVVADIGLARGDLRGLVSRVLACSPESRILLLSVHDEPAARNAARAAGAHGIVAKRSIVTDLLPAIDEVLAGRLYFPRDP